MSKLEYDFREWQLRGPNVQNAVKCHRWPDAYINFFDVLPRATRARNSRVTQQKATVGGEWATTVDGVL